MNDTKYNLYVRKLISHVAKKPEYWHLAHQSEELPDESCYALLSESLKKLDVGGVTSPVFKTNSVLFLKLLNKKKTIVNEKNLQVLKDKHLIRIGRFPAYFYLSVYTK